MGGNSFDCFDLEQTIARIATSLGAGIPQVRAAVKLLDDDNTIPFIARYRKEMTQGLDELVLRGIEDALSKSRELAHRQATILKSIDEQGLLTDELRRQVMACLDKKTLEDLYLPFKPNGARGQLSPVSAACSRWPTFCCGKKRCINRVRCIQTLCSADKDVPDDEAALQGA